MNAHTHHHHIPAAQNHDRYRLSMPAATNAVVTQGHADYCAANGHANGNGAHFCHRCGANAPTMSDAQIEEAQGWLDDCGLPVPIAAQLVREAIAREYEGGVECFVTATAALGQDDDWFAVRAYENGHSWIDFQGPFTACAEWVKRESALAYRAGRAYTVGLV